MRRSDPCLDNNSKERLMTLESGQYMMRQLRCSPITLSLSRWMFAEALGRQSPNRP